MTWPTYELAAYYNYAFPPKVERKTVRVHERVVLRQGSGEKVLSSRIQVRICRVHRGKVVLV